MDEARQELETEIARTREQLGETVSALAEKTDLKAQARRRWERLRRQLSQKAATVRGSSSEPAARGTGTGPLAKSGRSLEPLLTWARADPKRVLATGLSVGLVVGHLTRRRRS